MALIVYDGFDHYNSTADMMQRFGVWQYNSFNSAGIIPNGRAGYGKMLAIGYGTGSAFNAVLSTPINQVTIGFAVNFSGSNANLTFTFYDALTGATQCTWILNSTLGTITFVNALGQTIATGLNCLSANGWYFVELQNVIGPVSGATPGTAAIRINGQRISSFPDLVGVDTQAAGAHASFSMFHIQTSAYNALGAYMDDLYIADGTTGPGSYPNNSFLGDVRSASLFPISNSAVSWVPLANSNWQEVSETAMDSDTSYNRTATAGAQDSFNLGALDVDVNQVIGLQVTVAVRKEDAGSRTVAPVVVIAGVTYVGTAVSVDVSYLYITSLWPINPGTGASWTAADVNGMQAGYVVVT